MKIEKKWSICMAVLMALVTLTMSVAPAIAQDDAVSLSAAEPLYSIKDGLAIIVPIGAPVNTPVTMTVLKRSDASPAEGAGVWALTPGNAEILRQRLSVMQESGEISSTDVDWDAIVQVYGRFLGRTNERGKLTTSFDETGRYVLWAVKRGYVPGYTSIVIGGRLKALEIRAPNRAKVGERVTMTVFQKGTGNPITGAGVWALTREQAEAFKQDVEAMKEDTALASDELEWESVVSIHGIFLGRTGENGELITAFAESGGYLLVAVKRSYLPARHGIYIFEQPKAMILCVQQVAEVDDIVPIHVSETSSSEPIMGVGIWALTREQTAALREQMSTIRYQTRNTQDMDWESLVSISGSFLGITDDHGYLETSFGTPGGYVLVAVKPGYIPGFGFIFIKQPKPEVELESAKLRAEKVQKLEIDNSITVEDIP